MAESGPSRMTSGGDPRVVPQVRKAHGIPQCRPPQWDALCQVSAMDGDNGLGIWPINEVGTDLCFAVYPPGES